MLQPAANGQAPAQQQALLDLHALLLSPCTIATLKTPLLALQLLHGTLTVLQQEVNGQALAQLSISRCWTCAPFY